MKILYFLCLVLVLMLMLNGCNTMAGVGRDIRDAGKALERTADQARTTPPATEFLDETEIELMYPTAR